MMRPQRYRFLVTFILVMLSAAGAAAQEFRATIRGPGPRLEQGRAAWRHGHRAEHRNQRGRHGDLERPRQLHHPISAARFLHVDGRSAGVPEVHSLRAGARGQPDGDHQHAARPRRPDGGSERDRRVAAARDQQREPRHRDRQQADRRAATAVAQSVRALGAGRRRELQRPGDLPAPIRQRRAGRLVDERRTEPQQ